MDNSILFFKIWRNIIIKDTLLNYIKIYNNHKYTRSIRSQNEYKSIESYNDKKYLQSLSFTINGRNVKYCFETLNKLIKSTNESCDYKFYFSEYYKAEDEDKDEEEEEEDNDNEEGNEEEERINRVEKVKEKLYVSECMKGIVSLVYGQFYEVVVDKELPNLINISKVVFESIKSPIESPVFPETIQELSFEYTSVQLNYLPSSLKSLIIGSDYSFDFSDCNSNTEINKLPLNLSKLVITKPNQFKSNVLPPTLKELYLIKSIDYQISTEWIPKGIEKLIFCCQTEIPINENGFSNLTNLKTLKFENGFKSSLCNDDKSTSFLPNSVTNLVLKCPFNSFFPACFPSDIKTLKMRFEKQAEEEEEDQDQDKSIEGVQEQIPVTIGLNVLPNSLEYLWLQKNHSFLSIESIPASLVKIGGINSIEQLQRLPNHIVDVRFSDSFNDKIKNGDIPSHIVKLTFGKYYTQTLEKDCLTNCTSLKSIRFKYGIFINDGSLPDNVDHLEFHESHGNIPFLPGGLPNGLKSMVLQNQWYSKNLMCGPASIPNLLAISVMSYDRPLKFHYFPSSLQILEFFSFDKTDLSKLPNSLTTLIAKGPGSLIKSGMLPSSLNVIYVSSDCSEFLHSNIDQEILKLIKVLNGDDMDSIFNNLISKL